MEYELINSETLFEQLDSNKWYYIAPANDHSNVTGIRFEKEANKIYVNYIGGDFEEPFLFFFTYTKECLNACWRHEFQENYEGLLEPSIDDLSWVDEISSIPYTWLMETEEHFSEHIGVIE